MTNNSSNQGVPGRYRPTAAEVDLLVRQAAAHPFGTGFLENGAIDAVAATFGVHAFVVDEARLRLDGRTATTLPRSKTVSSQT